MSKLLTLLLTFVLVSQSYSFAQNKKADSVVIRIGEESKVIFSIHERDLTTLKQYDFQALMNDMIYKLENKDTARLSKPSTSYLKDPVKEQNAQLVQNSSDSDTTKESRYERRKRRNWNRRTYHSFNLDFGTNNYLSNGKFPDQSNALYTVRPWGSWYVGLNSVQRTHVGGNLFVEWGIGMSWYNFKFQNDQVVVSKTDNTVEFNTDARQADFIKSKLTATYINASFVPVIDFSKAGRKTTIFDGSRVDFSDSKNHSSSLRIGAGVYAGYRLDSYSKQVYKVDGKEQKDRTHDNFYLNNIRYGVRLQLGFNDVDLFFNYDLNNLFVDTKGPKLNAFSFGLTF